MCILILSGCRHYAVNLIRQGASGYLNKECDPSDIVDAIRVISLGKRYIHACRGRGCWLHELNRRTVSPRTEQLSGVSFRCS
jgi:DNA-binding NarL/FixJ family response regulator